MFFVTQGGRRSQAGAWRGGQRSNRKTDRKDRLVLELIDYMEPFNNKKADETARFFWNYIII